MRNGLNDLVRGAYCSWLVEWNEMTSSFYEDVGPVPFLMNYSSEVAGIVCPRSRRFATENLNAAKGCILEDIASVSYNTR